MNPRVVAGWGESRWWTVQSCRGIARFSILNTDENRDARDAVTLDVKDTSMHSPWQHEAQIV